MEGLRVLEGLEGFGGCLEGLDGFGGFAGWQKAALKANRKPLLWEVALALGCLLGKVFGGFGGCLEGFGGFGGFWSVWSVCGLANGTFESP